MNGEQRLRCPQCGAEMNFHAEKVDTSRGFEDPATDPDLGGVLVEFAVVNIGSAHQLHQSGKIVHD